MAVAPPTLTRQQLLAVAAARGQQQPNADPYAGIIGGLPKPQTTGQIQSQAQGEISPLVAAITGLIGKQTNAATHAIGGYSADAAAKLAALNFEQPYTQGEQGQSSVDAALRQSLAGAGNTDADALASRLAVINDPSVAAASSTLSANGAANGNTQLAQGSAALANLIANAASAKSYGQKQPGIAQLAGLQEIGAAQQNGQNNIASQTSQLEQQLPSIVNSLTSENDSRSSALTAARENQLARNDAINATTANNQTKITTAKIAARTKTADAEIAAQGKATAAQVAAARSDRTYRLQFAKTFGFDPITNRTLPGYTRDQSGQVVKVAAPKSTKPTPDYPNLTKTQVVHLRAGVSSAFYGVPAQKDVNGKVVRNSLPPVNYQGAITEAFKAGYSRAAAIKMANRFYMPGQRGRPQKTAP